MPDAAILKLKAWHPGTKHGGQETTKSRNLICPAGTPHRRFLKRHFQGIRPHFTCVSIFHLLEEQISLRGFSRYPEIKCFMEQ